MPVLVQSAPDDVSEVVCDQRDEETAVSLLHDGTGPDSRDSLHQIVVDDHVHYKCDHADARIIHYAAFPLR